MVFSEYRCPPLPHIEAASAVNNPINATVGNTEEVVCDEGFIFAATMTSRVLECGNDKQWRGNTDACGRKSRTIVWYLLEVSLDKIMLHVSHFLQPLRAIQSEYSLTRR